MNYPQVFSLWVVLSTEKKDITLKKVRIYPMRWVYYTSHIPKCPYAIKDLMLFRDCLQDKVRPICAFRIGTFWCATSINEQLQMNNKRATSTILIHKIPLLTPRQFCASQKLCVLTVLFEVASSH